MNCVKCDGYTFNDELCINCQIKQKENQPNRKRGRAVFRYKIPICSCDHNQLAHYPSLIGVQFHGACVVRGCFCTKFTWTDKFEITKQKSDAEEQLPIGILIQ